MEIEDLLHQNKDKSMNPDRKSVDSKLKKN